MPGLPNGERYLWDCSPSMAAQNRLCEYLDPSNPSAASGVPDRQYE